MGGLERADFVGVTLKERCEYSTCAWILGIEKEFQTTGGNPKAAKSRARKG